MQFVFNENCVMAFFELVLIFNIFIYFHILISFMNLSLGNRRQ